MSQVDNVTEKADGKRCFERMENYARVLFSTEKFQDERKQSIGLELHEQLKDGTRKLISATAELNIR